MNGHKARSARYKACFGCLRTSIAWYHHPQLGHIALNSTYTVKTHLDHTPALHSFPLRPLPPENKDMSSSTRPGASKGSVHSVDALCAATSGLPLVFPTSSTRPRSCIANGGKRATHRRRTPSEPSPPPGYSCRLCNEEWTCLPRLFSLPSALEDLRIDPPPSTPIVGKVKISPRSPQKQSPQARRIDSRRPLEEQLLEHGVRCDLATPLTCCGNVLTNYHMATLHLIGHINETQSPDANKVYPCILPSCEHRGRDADDIARHVLSDRHLGAKVVCPGCGKQDSRPDSLAWHLYMFEERGGSLEMHLAH